MTDLVDRVVASTGLDRAVAEKATGIILDFLSKEGPADKVSALIARLPGGEALLQTARADDSGEALGGMGGIMGVGTRLMGAGLDISQIQALTKELMAFSREHGAGDILADIAAAIPGLSQFV